MAVVSFGDAFVLLAIPTATLSGAFVWYAAPVHGFTVKLFDISNV